MAGHGPCCFTNMRALLLLLALLALPAAHADDGPTISGGEGDAATPRDIPVDQCRAIFEGTAARQEPRMGGGDERSPTDVSGLSDTCPGAQQL